MNIEISNVLITHTDTITTEYTSVPVGIAAFEPRAVPVAKNTKCNGLLALFCLSLAKIKKVAAPRPHSRGQNLTVS